MRSPSACALSCNPNCYWLRPCALNCVIPCKCDLKYRLLAVLHLPTLNLQQPSRSRLRTHTDQLPYAFSACTPRHIHVKCSCNIIQWLYVPLVYNACQCKATCTFFILSYLNLWSMWQESGYQSGSADVHDSVSNDEGNSTIIPGVVQGGCSSLKPQQDAAGPVLVSVHHSDSEGMICKNYI